MIRKHFRFKRLVLGLAFAAFAVPSTAAATYYVDGGPAPVSKATTGSQSYLGYHSTGTPAPAVAKSDVRSENGVRTPTLTPAQVEAMRWEALARVYQQQQSSPATSERSNGVPGPDPSLVPQIVSTTSSSFDWQDAGIGASIAFAVALLLISGIAFGRRNRSTLASA